MNKFLKWLLGILVFLMLSFLAVYVIIMQRGNQIIKETILKDYNENADNPYHVDFNSVKVSLTNKSIDIDDITITLKDSLVTLVRVGSNQVPNTNVSVHVNNVHIDGFDLQEVFQERKLKAQEFVIAQPDIEVFEYPENNYSTEKPQDTVDLRSVFLTYFDTFSLNKVAIVEARTRYYSVSAAQDTQKIFGLENLSYSMFDVVANKYTLYSEKIISFNHYGMETSNLSLNLPKVGKIKVGGVSYDSQKREVNISEMEYLPAQTAEEVFYTNRYRKPWIAAKFKSLQIGGLNLKETLEKQHLEIETLRVINPILDVRVDLGLPFHPDDVKPLLSEQINSIPYPLTIHRLSVKSATINAKLKGANTDLYGELNFAPMHIIGTNVTNHSMQITANNNCNLLVETRINSTGKINATIEMDLASTQGRTIFNVDGTNINLTQFNKTLTPIVRVKVTNGEMKKLTLRSVISKNICKGYMDAHYENMLLSIENKDSQKRPNLVQHIASGIANGVLKNNNIPNKKNYHTGHYQFEKHPHDSFYKLLWLVHLYGLEDSILGSNAKDKRKAKKKENQGGGWLKFNFKK